MNDIKFSLGVLKSIFDEARREDLSFAEKAGLYAALRGVCVDFDEYIEEKRHGHGYAHEKVGRVLWHLGAALGFDVTNGHDKSQHLSWAFGDMDTLGGLLIQGDE